MIKYKLLFSILSILFFIPNIYSYENNLDELIEYKSEYLLGPGDVLKIEFDGLEIFDDFYIVQSDGNINLPEIGLVDINKKSLTEIKIIILEKYKKVIKSPSITINIAKHRPLLVTLRGEVNKTGLFPLLYKYDDDDENFYSQTSPRLFDLIKLGNGITQNADLSKIQVIRRNSIKNGGGKIKTNINLIALLEKGDHSQNIELRDGDDIFVPKSKEPILEQLIGINKSNLTPQEMIVFINGNVPETGKFKIRQGTSVFEAIAEAGGPKSGSGKIEFLRLNKDGTTEKRILKFNNLAKKGSFKNPILLSGDIIFVRQSIIGKANSFLKEYATPIINTYGVYKIFD